MRVIEVEDTGGGFWDVILHIGHHEGTNYGGMLIHLSREEAETIAEKIRAYLETSK